MFCNVPGSSGEFQGISQGSTTFHGGSVWVLCLYLSLFCLCVVVSGHVWSLSGLGVTLCGCVGKLVCVSSSGELATELSGFLAGVGVA